MLGETREKGGDTSFPEDAVVIGAGSCTYCTSNVSTAGDDPSIHACEHFRYHEKHYRGLRELLWAAAVDQEPTAKAPGRPRDAACRLSVGIAASGANVTSTGDRDDAPDRAGGGRTALTTVSGVTAACP